MIYRPLILFLTLLYLSSSQQTINIQFQVKKKHPNWDNSIVLGKLTINIILQHRLIQSDFNPYHKQLIHSTDFEDNNPLIIEFIPTKSSHIEYMNNYLTSVDQYNNNEHGQKIVLITGFAQGRFHINSINYVQTRDRIGEIYTTVLYTQEEYHQIFKYNQAAKKNAQEQQSFFSKYKWPLIIGGVVLYTMLTVDPKAAEAAAANR